MNVRPRVLFDGSVANVSKICNNDRQKRPEGTRKASNRQCDSIQHCKRDMVLALSVVLLYVIGCGQTYKEAINVEEKPKIITRKLADHLFNDCPVPYCVEMTVADEAIMGKLVTRRVDKEHSVTEFTDFVNKHEMVGYLTNGILVIRTQNSLKDTNNLLDAMVDEFVFKGNYDSLLSALNNFRTFNCGYATHGSGQVGVYELNYQGKVSFRQVTIDLAVRYQMSCRAITGNREEGQHIDQDGKKAPLFFETSEFALFKRGSEKALKRE